VTSPLYLLNKVLSSVWGASCSFKESSRTSPNPVVIANQFN